LKFLSGPLLRPRRTEDAVLPLVPNVKERLEAKHLIPLWVFMIC
jgi:hypothetical protein